MPRSSQARRSFNRISGILLFVVIVLLAVWLDTRQKLLDVTQRECLTYDKAPASAATGRSGQHAVPIMSWQDKPWRIMVSPKHKLIFCSMYKVASTQFDTLFHRLWDNPYWNNFYQQDFSKGNHWFKNYTLEMFNPLDRNASKMMTDPSWYKAIFVRDPLDRLLSGFQDKCLRPGKNAPHCPAKGEENRTSLSKVVDALWNKLYGGNWEKHIREMDNHFLSQAVYCGSNRFLPYFNYVGVFDKTNLADQAFEMMKEVGIEEYMNGWGRHHNESLFVSPIKEKGFDSTEAKLRHFFPPKLAAKARDLYQVDYELFSQVISPPSWASYEG
mmetsp:Transcript_13040/g.25271  ORF Transcript_13040/g.25271 Transcript_13040/m.25271 type:complete len:328 (-) Transcript_13040:296-1279(-)